MCLLKQAFTSTHPLTHLPSYSPLQALAHPFAGQQAHRRSFSSFPSLAHRGWVGGWLDASSSSSSSSSSCGCGPFSKACRGVGAEVDDAGAA